MQNAIVSMVQSYIKNSDPYNYFIKNKLNRLYLENLSGYLLANSLTLFQRKIDGNVWALCSTEMEAKELCKDLSELKTPYIYLPSNNKVLYSPFSGSESEYEQLRALANILEKRGYVIVTTIRTFTFPLLNPTSVEETKFSIKVNDKFDPQKIAKTLSEGGYYRSPKTSVVGEFSLQGEVVDFFPFGEESAVRIYGDWDKVDKITYFEPFSQKIIKSIASISINLVNDNEKSLIGSIDQYMKKDDYIFFVGKERLESSFHSLKVEAKALYREAFLVDRSSLKPDEILFNYLSFYDAYTSSSVILDVEGQHKGSYKFNVEGPRSFFGNFILVKEHINQLLKNNYKVVVYAASKLQKERLQSMLSMFDNLIISENSISGGFTLSDQKLSVICNHEIFGRRKEVVKTLHKVETSPLDSFVDLNEGDYVVHINYGVGKFEKIDRLKTSGKERDYIKILYGNEEYLFVPIEQANLIQRYIGSEGGKVALDYLGGQGWSNKKQRARKAAQELASRLITLYARRKSSRGFPFNKDTDWQVEFEASFPFEESEDQLKCIEDVKNDMESPIVMDRLICGDVGYGKTEIAFRAAFKAVMANKQVAFLAPTTILADQHFATLKERLGDFPVRVALLSRMVAPKEQKKILKSLKEGKVDIVVGTHRLLQKDVQYKDLGLLVIDEEQRFGVKDKERFKELKANVDSLALSATPIPRTLYMSLLKIRDISLLTTPPIQRRPIETIIKEFNLETLVKAINFEVERGGQVFYLHNRIKSIDEVVTMLNDAIPNVTVASIHGRMAPEEIESIMDLFIKQSIQVLVSTTLIENGIDIPNVNTIIIDRSDQYGLSQLYQLRGRVGRSDRKAFAYLFYPELSVINEVAVKRLKVLSQHTELGSGFKIALKDMEIRGTGNLLGKEQSGQLASVGLDMYLRILDEEIQKLTQDGKVEQEQEVFLELDYEGYIPDSYISEPTLKFDVYKKIASISDEASLNALKAELVDRFGTINEFVENLFYIAELKIISRKLSIVHLREKNGVVTVEFAKVKDLDIDKVLQLINLGGGKIKLDPKQLNVLKLTTDAISLKDKALFILETLQRLI